MIRVQSGLMRVQTDQPLGKAGFVAGAAVFIVAAGIMHLVAAPLHWEHAPAHGLFFALSGIAEVVWGVAFWRRSSVTLYRTGVVMAGGLIVLWAITRLLPAPFGHGPEEVDAFGVVCKLSEGLGLSTLVALAMSGTTKTKLGAWRAGSVLGIATLMVGLGTYGIASAAGPALPWLRAPAAYQPAGGLLVQVEAAHRHDEPIGDAGAVLPTAGQPDAHADRLELVVAGIATPFANGGKVALGGDLVAELTLQSGAARHSRSLDVYLHREATPSEPIADGTIQALARMRYMDHGTFRQTGQPSGDGHYLLPLRFAMPGEWQLDLEIAASGQRATTQLDLDLFE